MADRTRAGLALVLSVVFGALGPSIVRAGDAASPDPYVASLDRLYDLQDKIRDIHPAFETLYPVAVIEQGRFFVYVPDPGRRTYELDKEAAEEFQIPIGVRAAMPLPFWENRMACVITPEIFAETGGYAVIFHEFVHCYQWGTCELRLKNSLRIYKTAMERKDFMWELQYPFPYGDEGIAADYRAVLEALVTEDEKRADSLREAIRDRLSPEAWEYMTWQEWKEGTARYLENEIKARLELPANRGGLEAPLTRVSFYAGGELLIRLLAKKDPRLVRDIEALYRRIAD
jgi:hypothetical protein